MPQNISENPNKKDGKKDLFNPSASGKNSSQRDKKVFIFLILIILLALPFSVWQIGRQLKSPLERKKANTNANQSPAVVNTQITRIESLRDQDTDKDGLSDYDELYVYKTSPYLQDSDSDSISDKLEIEQGTDPNCPKGQTCGRTATNVNGLANGTANSNASAAITDLTNVTPDQLRQIMKDAGAPADQLNNISDADLLKTYQDILLSEGSNINLNTSAGATNTSLNNSDASQSTLGTLDYQTLYNLSPAEIRQLVIENGVPKETLDKVDDASLQQIYRDALQQNLQENLQNTNL